LKPLNISLWTLILINFGMACVLLFAPYSFSIALEQVIVSFIPKESSILDKNTSASIPNIKVNGVIDGETEIVKRQTSF